MITISIVLSGCGTGNKVSKLNSQPANQANNTKITNQESNSSTNSSAGGATEKPVAPENNPVGDIPDNQVFVKYESVSGGYLIQVPEGWARTENGTDVRFIDKFDGVQVKVSKTTDMFSIDNIRKNQAAAIEKSDRAVTVKDVKQVKLNGGSSAIVVSFESNSDPDPVTNKQVHLENESYYFNKDGNLACVTVWAPLGADNVDQWNFISNSFGWQ